MESKLSQSELDKYIKSLNEKERIAIEIAREHLQSSFDIMKCNGFHEYKRKHKYNQNIE